MTVLKILVSLSLFFLHLNSLALVTAYFSPNGGVKDNIIAELKKCTSGLDIAMYSLSDPQIIAHLTKLSQEGVPVRLILNKAQQVAAKSTALEEAGIDVRYVNLIMHHKFAIIDGPQHPNDSSRRAVLLTGSQNWAGNADSAYDEDFLVFRKEPEIIRAFQAEFNLMWNKARDFAGPASTGVGIPEIERPLGLVLFTSQNFAAKKTGPFWSFRPTVPLEKGVAGLAIINAIEQAQRSVQIATTHFRRRDIFDALIKAHVRGVSIEIILDGQEYSTPTPSPLPSEDTEHLDETLSSAGIEVRYKMYSRFWDFRSAKQMHSKYMIIDQRKVLTGTFNWSENAELNTFENLLLLEGPIVQQYLTNFQKILNYGQHHFAQLISAVVESSGMGPCHFSPLSLSPGQIKSLRKSYAPRACR